MDEKKEEKSMDLDRNTAKDKTTCKGWLQTLDDAEIISNWNREFDAWTPTVRKLVYIGDKNDRKRIQKRLTNQGFDVPITTLQLVVTTMSTTMPLTVDDLKSSLDFYKDQAKSAPIRMPKPYIITADMINSLSLTSYYQGLHSRKMHTNLTNIFQINKGFQVVIGDWLSINKDAPE